MEVKPGRFHVLYLVVNDAVAQNIDDAEEIFDDLADIAAIRQEEASQGDQ